MCDVCEGSVDFEVPEIGVPGEARASKWSGNISEVVLAGLQREDGVVEYGVYIRYADKEDVDGATIGVMGDTLLRWFGGVDYSKELQATLDQDKES
jgi:hypothetical protein